MIRCQFVNMPDYFTGLLRSNMNSTSKSYQNIQMYIHQRPAFLGLFKRAFEGTDQEVHIEKLIKTMSWNGIRDRLAAMFITHLETGEFPKNPDVRIISPIIDLEEQLKPFTVSGQGRAFLLGLYLKLMNTRPTQPIDFSLNWNIGEGVIDRLKHSKAKVLMIDWLVLYLKHLEVFLGVEKLERVISEYSDYRSTLALLEIEQRELMISNFLAYGASIGESEIFTMRRV